MKSLLRRTAVANLPAGYPVDIHFNPSYDPGDQRLCLDADGDLFRCNPAPVGSRSSPITSSASTRPASHQLRRAYRGRHRGHRNRAATAGPRRRDDQPGRHRDQTAGPVHLQGAHARRGAQPGVVRGLPTPRGRCAPTSRPSKVAKLLSYMTSHGYHAYPHLSGKPQAEKLAWDIQTGYVARSPHTAAEVWHQAAVERAAELLRRRHRPPLRPHR